MSNKKADGTQMVNGVAVVAPDNMGKGHKWLESENKYEVATGEGLGFDDNGNVEVQLHPGKSNLLQMKDGKIYYGIEPPANVANLYVDAENGVDQDPNVVPGAGTKEKPLRTIKFANSFAVLGTTRSIYLRCNQDHVLEHHAHFDIISGSLFVYPYGPEYDAALEKHGGDWSGGMYELISNGTAPRIVFHGVGHIAGPPTTKEYTWFSFACFSLEAGASVNVFGTRLINDVGVHIHKATDAVSTDFRFGTLARMVSRAGASLRFDRCKFECVGELKADTTNNGFSQASWEKQIDGQKTYIVGFLHPQGGNINLLHCRAENNLKCQLVAHQGWDQQINSGLSISLVQGNDVQAFAKRVYGAKIDNQNGVKILLAPRSDVSATFFE